MTIQYCSDLHLEFQANKGFLKENPIIPSGDVLILAGDIVPFSLMNKHEDFFSFCADNFKETYWIPGNHEYYGFDIAQKSGTFHEKVKSNVHLLNNTCVELADSLLIFSTMWSKINPAHQWQIERGVNDFQVIKNGAFRFTVDRFNELHEDSFQFLSKSLLENKLGKSVVVTHHVPTLQYYPQQYKGSVLNDAFAVELTDFIELHQPTFWIYGHHHQNTPEFKINETTLLTNQLGYVEMREHLNFKNNLTIN
ncbi:MAG: metallophosphoesterase [Crocinitomicaceae bacterium]|nr:metallophosphoesterase [Crocinitomicaceae bacterium]